MVTATSPSYNSEVSYIIYASVSPVNTSPKGVNLVLLRSLDEFAMSSIQINLGPNAAEYM